MQSSRVLTISLFACACALLATCATESSPSASTAMGNPVTTVGKYLTVWKKQADGSWKVAVDAPSEDAPPAPPAAPPFGRLDAGTVRPWTALVPMTTNQASRGVTAGPLFEYACHEGNYGLLNIMRGPRADDAAR